MTTKITSKEVDTLMKGLELLTNTEQDSVSHRRLLRKLLKIKTIVEIDTDKLFYKLEKSDYTYGEMIAFLKEVRA